MSNRFKIPPAIMPSKVVRPASYKYLCPLFFKKWPKVIDIISKKSMINISVEISI